MEHYTRLENQQIVKPFVDMDKAEAFLIDEKDMIFLVGCDASLVSVEKNKGAGIVLKFSGKLNASLVFREQK